MKTMEERFWEKVNKTSTCWLWTAGKNDDGYGRITKPYNAGSMFAHRYSYELAYGPFDPDLLVLHKCDTPACVRPDHLFLGDHADNMADRSAKGRTRNGHHGQTHCKQGHLFSPENTAMYKGHRYCRECHKAHGRKRWTTKKKR